MVSYDRILVCGSGAIADDRVVLHFVPVLVIECMEDFTSDVEASDLRLTASGDSAELTA